MSIRLRLPNSPELPQDGKYSSFIPRFYTLWRMLRLALDEIYESIETIETSAGGQDLNTYVRLSLDTDLPVAGPNITGATDIYVHPFGGNSVPLWDGSAWVQTFFTKKTLALGTLTAHTNYDVFGYLDSDTLAVEKLAWLNATVTVTIASPAVFTWNSHGLAVGDPVVFTTTGALPTGLTANTMYWVTNVPSANTFRVSATFSGSDVNTSGSQSGTHTGWQSRQRGTEISLQDGRWCKTGDKTRLYLGTFRTTSTTTTEDSGGNAAASVGGKRFLFNQYNQFERWAGVWEDSSWVYSSTTWRQAAGNFDNKVEFVIGTQSPYQAFVHGYCTSTTAANFAVGIGVDRTTVNENAGYGTGAAADVGTGVSISNGGLLGPGYKFVAWLEIGFGSGSQVWYGQSSPQVHSGLRVMARI